MKWSIKFKIFILILLLYLICFIKYFSGTHYVFYYEPKEISKDIINKLKIHKINSFITYASGKFLDNPFCNNRIIYDDRFNISKIYEVQPASSVGYIWVVENKYDSNENIISYNRFEAYERSNNIDNIVDNCTAFGFTPYTTDYTYYYDDKNEINKITTVNFFQYEISLYSDKKIFEKIISFTGNSTIRRSEYKYKNNELIEEINYFNTCNLNARHDHPMFEYRDDKAYVYCYPKNSVKNIKKYQYDKYGNVISFIDKHFGSNPYDIKKIYNHDYIFRKTELSVQGYDGYLRKEIINFDENNLITRKEFYHENGKLSKIEQYNYE